MKLIRFIFFTVRRGLIGLVVRRSPLMPKARGSIRCRAGVLETGIFSHVFIVPDPLEGGIERLVLSEKDEKFRRSRVHVAHVKDPSAVGNRKE